MKKWMIKIKKKMRRPVRRALAIATATLMVCSVADVGGIATVYARDEAGEEVADMGMSDLAGNDIAGESADMDEDGVVTTAASGEHSDWDSLWIALIGVFIFIAEFAVLVVARKRRKVAY